jgi:glucose/arabinose dehydrogenase
VLAIVGLTFLGAGTDASGHADHPSATTPDTSAPGLRLVPVAEFGSRLTYLTSPRADRRRQFVATKRGMVWVLRDGQRLSRRFLDVRDLVRNEGEGGFLSIAFAPDYATSGVFYVAYTMGNKALRVDEFKRSTTNPDRAVRDSRRPVITIPHDWSVFHYGGQLQFGHDGYLYLSTGDGGGEGDPKRNGQNRESLLGKVLRIDPRRPTATRGYSVPAENPFVGRAGRDEIWAYGLRNPWRFSFDRLNGDFALGDVGQSKREEVNFKRFGAEGMNFGWNCFEGTLAYSGCRAPGHVPPVLQYSHAGMSCAVTGGYVVRDSRLPQLAGQYVYGDYCTGALHTAKLRESGATNKVYLSLVVPRLTSFGEDADGRIYATSWHGTVYRLDPRPG